MAGWFAWAREECREGHRSVLEKTLKGEKRVEGLWKPQVDGGLSHMVLYWNWSGFDMAQSAGNDMVASTELAKGVWYRLLFGWHFLLCYCFLFLMTATSLDSTSHQVCPDSVSLFDYLSPTLLFQGNHLCLFVSFRNQFLSEPFFPIFQNNIFSKCSLHLICERKPVEWSTPVTTREA